MRANIRSAINSVYKGLLISKEDIDRQASKYSNRIDQAPTQERALTGIARQQEIKAGLYMMLLQNVKKTPSLWQLRQTMPRS